MGMHFWIEAIPVGYRSNYDACTAIIPEFGAARFNEGLPSGC